MTVVLLVILVPLAAVALVAAGAHGWNRWAAQTTRVPYGRHAAPATSSPLVVTPWRRGGVTANEGPARTAGGEGVAPWSP